MAGIAKKIAAVMLRMQPSFGLTDLVRTPVGLMRCVQIDRENKTAGFIGEIAYAQEKFQRPTHTFRWDECGGRS